jgi:quercetin dioxygenase-like cupin family protein
MRLQTRDIRPRQAWALLPSLAEVNERAAAPVPEYDSVTAVAFDTVVAEVGRDGGVRFAPRLPGPPPRVDGHVLALTSLEHSPPHLGERHPDGDELIYLLSGEVTVVIEAPGGDQRPTLGPGDALIVAQGLWHHIEVIRPAQLVHFTPGPSGEHRPARPPPTRRPR